MNLREVILQEHSKNQATRIVNWIGDDQKKFDQLIELFLKGEYRVTQRAAWPLSYCVSNHPYLVKKHMKNLLLNLRKPGLHDAVIRNTLRLMQFIDIPETLQGLATEICFELFNDKRQPIAVKVFSMTVLGNISKTHPALKNELKLSIEMQLPYGSAGFLSRAKKVLKEIR